MARFVRFRWPTLGQGLAALSVFGGAILLYVAGAAVMYFGLPTSGLLRDAFRGGQAAREREQGRTRKATGLPADVFQESVVIIDRPDQTFDGFTLYTTTFAMEARLIDMRGNVVHRWKYPFSKAWPRAPQRPGPFPDDKIHWFRCHLYPNGDLLAIYHANGDTPYGYGLAKLDKDSKLLWVYSQCVHHDLDVGEDGRIYTLTQTLQSKAPAGISIPTPFIADQLVILSPEGKELDTLPILDAFHNTPYLMTLASVKIEKVPDADDQTAALVRGDFFHTNSVKVLRGDMASKFPQFKAGQVMISMRNRETLALLDLPSRSVVWSAAGVWRLQHDPEFLDNGHLLLFDNFGSGKNCRILEYDPVTQALPWFYTTGFSAALRGMKQRLPNGNTLIVDPNQRRLLEVTLKKELVWQYYTPILDWTTNPTVGDYAITGAHRYAPKELTFLTGGQRARP